MKVAVLGATGRTGRVLVEELLRRGHDVRVLVRDPGRLGEVADRVEVVQGDSRDACRPTLASAASNTGCQRAKAAEVVEQVMQMPPDGPGPASSS